jgi:AcrR family transcriptional regulator
MRLMVTRRHYDCNRKETSMSGTKQKSQSVSKAVARRNGAEQPADSRAGRTRARINGAFVILLHRRSYDNMRVSDITKKAGVGRATFYAHFTSKDDLLRSQLQRVVVPMLRMQPKEPFLLDCRSFFEHIRTAPHIYKALMGGHERNGARVIREAFEQHLGSALTTTSPSIDGTIPAALVKRFVVSVLLGVAAHTLNSAGETTAEEMQRLFQKLVGSGLSV